MNNLRGVDLNLLVVLDALLSERHVSRAALRLNMSQPAVSHALARLRILLDDPLFTRHGGGLLPTVRALELSQPLTEALAQIRSVLGPDGFDPASSRHVFRLAMSDYGANIVLPHLVKQLRRAAPGIDLSVTQSSREGMISGVVDGNVDIGLGVFSQLPAQILAEHLLSDQYACLVDRSSLPSPDIKLKLNDYLSRSHVLVAVHGDASTEIDEAVHAAGFSRRVALVLPHWSVAPTTVMGTDLILTVAARSLEAVRGNKELVVLDCPVELPPIPFMQISHRRRQPDPALRWLRSLITRIIQPDFAQDKSDQEIGPENPLPSP